MEDGCGPALSTPRRAYDFRPGLRDASAPQPVACRYAGTVYIA